MKIANFQFSIAKYDLRELKSVARHYGRGSVDPRVVVCGTGWWARPTLRAFSLIEMMIAIVILGLGLVMTATMFPVAWTRARTLTEYTTQRVVSQSAAATIAESLRASGSSFVADPNAATPTGNYFLSTASLAGDLVYDSQLHTDLVNGLPPAELEKCVLVPSDTRVHALHMENLRVEPENPPLESRRESPFEIENMPPLCDVLASPPHCSDTFPPPDGVAQCSIDFCLRSFYWPQVSIGARMYPPLDSMPDIDANAAAKDQWLQRFSSRRYTWAVLHRLRNYVGPDYQAVQKMLSTTPLPTLSERSEFAAQAAAAAGTTRTFDFYIVTLKRAQATSRFALQSRDADALPDPTDRAVAFKPVPLAAPQDVALPVAWRVQVEFPGMIYGVPATGVPTEVQVPATGASASDIEKLMLGGMFPAGTQFVDEITGRTYQVSRRRTNASNFALLTLDREVLPQDLDDSDDNQYPGASGVVDPHETLRVVWVFPPPIAERIDPTTVVFDDSTPVVGIDVRTISMSPPG